MSRQAAIRLRPRLIALAVLAASVGALAVAYVAEFVFGLEPCPLCLYQRVPYVVTGVLAVLALTAPASRRFQGFSVGACGVVFFVGAGLAIHHVGVEQHWWASAACGGGLPENLSLEEFKAQLTQPQLKACDEVPWSLFGVSMAGYNAVASLALAAATLAGARSLMHRGTP